MIKRLPQLAAKACWPSWCEKNALCYAQDRCGFNFLAVNLVGAGNGLEQRSLDSMKSGEVASCLMKTWGVCKLGCAQVIKCYQGFQSPCKKVLFSQ